MQAGIRTGRATTVVSRNIATINRRRGSMLACVIVFWAILAIGPVFLSSNDIKEACGK